MDDVGSFDALIDWIFIVEAVRGQGTGAMGRPGCDFGEDMWPLRCAFWCAASSPHEGDGSLSGRVCRGVRVPGSGRVSFPLG